MRGLDKSSEATACTVATISLASTTAGAITLANGIIDASSDRPVRVKTKIYVDGSSNKVFLNGTINIVRYPATNQTVYIDMSKITTQGQDS